MPLSPTARAGAARHPQSMSRRGNCLDNAPMESFFASLKKEHVHHARFHTRAEARAAVFEYLEVFYNRQRLHSALGTVPQRKRAPTWRGSSPVAAKVRHVGLLAEFMPPLQQTRPGLEGPAVSLIEPKPPPRRAAMDVRSTLSRRAPASGHVEVVIQFACPTLWLPHIVVPAMAIRACCLMPSRPSNCPGLTPGLRDVPALRTLHERPQ